MLYKNLSNTASITVPCFVVAVVIELLIFNFNLDYKNSFKGADSSPLKNLC